MTKLFTNAWRKALTVIGATLLVTSVWAQTVTIPAANTNTANNRKPYGCFFGFERTAAIYTAAEIGSSGTITDVAFFLNTVATPAASTPINIYMKQTASASMVASTVAVQEAGATLVYSGNITSAMLVAGTWVNVTLTAPFLYNNASNLEIIVEANFGGSGGEGSTAKQFRFSNGVAGCTQTWQADGSAPTGNGTLSASRPNITLIMTPLPACSGTPNPGTAVGSPVSICGSGVFNLSLTGNDFGPGITYQWQSSAVPGGPYSNEPGATNPTFTTGTVSSTTYYVCVVTCTNSGSSATTNEVTAAVFPPASVSVIPTSATMCQGDPAVALTASGATTYSWGPAAGLSATTGASVNASPSATTTYTVTGTDGNGCTGTATTTITVAITPTITAVTATPSNVCVGGNSQLNVVANMPSILITEVTLFRTGTGQTVSYPAYITGGDLVEISNISSNPIDISGYTLNDYASNSATSTHPTFTFPVGTIIPANGVSVVCLGTGVNDIANRYFNTGGTSDSWGSGSLVGIVLRNGSTIVDAVGLNSGYTFNAATGVTAANWTGFASSPSGFAGTIRTAPVDNNIGGDWTASSVIAPQTIGTYNAIYSTPPALTYSWAPATYLSATNIANPMATGIASSITYTVTATAGTCSTTGTVTITAGAALTATGSIAPSSTVCQGTSVTLGVIPTGGGAPYTYAWTGPNSFSSTSQNPAVASVTPAEAGTYTVVVTDACSSTFTVNVTLTVNPAPTISVTPTSTTYCTPGPGVSLTASGSSVSYNWAPSTGLSATTGTSVTASPTTSQTYTVVGTDGIGCTASATTTVTVGYAPSATTATANPASICLNGNSQLNAVATPSAPLNQYSFSTATGATLDPMSGATQVLNPGNDDTPTAAPTAIGFTFPFNGTNYTQFSVSPDGWILLGGATAANQFTNAVTSTTNIPKIYPYWDDLATGTDGNVSYVVTGTAPNRILVVQWFVTVPRAVGGPANSTFQCWMYETSGVFEFRYGTMGSNTGTTSVGATASAANYQSVTMSSNTASIVTPNDAQIATPASGRIYTFTPPAVTYAWSPATFLSSTTIANPMANNVSATTTWTVTPSSGGCPGSPATVTVTTGSVLTSSGSISPASTVCQGTNVTLNSVPVGGGAPYTYAWTGPNSFSSTVQNPTINGVTPAEAGTYTLVITDACAATNTVTLTLAVNAAPTLTVSPTSALFCSGGPGVAISASGTSTGYTWGPAAGLSSTTGSTVTASPTVTTTYTVTGTDGNGCTSTATTLVNYGDTPVPTASASPATICENGTSTLSVVAAPVLTYCQPVYSNGTGFGDYISSVVVNTLNNPTGPSTAPYYTLYPQAANTTTTLTAGSTYTITLVAGTYTINDVAAWIDYNQNGTLNNAGEKLGETDDLGAAPASTSFVFTVPVNAVNGTTRLRVRDVDHGGTNDMDPCLAQSTFGETEDYIITIVGGVDAFTYAWSPATFLNSTIVSDPVASAVTTTTTYSVIVTGTSGCSASASTTLTVNPLPTVTATAAPSTVCAGDMVTPTGGGASTYVWSGGLTDGVAFSALSTQTYTVTGTDGNGCSNTATATVTVNALPTVTASATPSTVCAGDMVTATGGGATSYAWSGGIMDNVAFAAMSTTTYTVTGTDANGCTNTATALVTVNALPTVTASATPSTVCAGDMVTPAGGGASSYAWSGGLTDAVPFAATVTDTYTVTGTDANGCSNTATVTVTVNALPTVAASVTPSTACVGDLVTPAGSGASTYVWSGSVTDGVAFPAAATETYTVTGTDVNGCSATTTVTLTVNPLPVVTASSTDSTVCVGDQITFMGGGATTYTWDNGVTDMVPYTTTGSMTFIVTGTDANGCMDTASLAITANALPNVTVSLPLDTACLLLGPVTLGGESPAGGTWSGTGVTGNTFDPGVAGNGMHAITYTYMDSLTGCSAAAIDSMLVDICNSIDNNEVGSAVVYPNPNNGDFTLIPAGSGLVDVYVYSATGQLVIAQKATCGVQNNVHIEASGMYSVVVVTADGTRTTQRVVVNR